MAPTVEITIPSTSTSTTSKPYTIYNINLRLPLRSFTLQKRFSDFTTLHSTLISQSSSVPPFPLPAKSWFARTTSSPELTEQRRRGLETYLQTINEHDDSRWQNTPAWRAFLNLPNSTISSKSSTASTLRNAAASSTGPPTDPIIWLDCHRELIQQLHSARLAITQRDSATNPQSQHESSATAKKYLVKAGGMITQLETGLKKAQDSWEGDRLGDGEVRRRRDLVSSARKEKDGLENLLNAMAAKSRVDAQISDKQALVGNGNPNANSNSSSTLFNGGGSGKPTTTNKKGRVLGKETDRTRQLDNTGVLQLQQQMMTEQDEDVEVLSKAIRKQKELGIAIQEELDVQKDMLGMLDEDVERVNGKIGVARKRVGKIS